MSETTWCFEVYNIKFIVCCFWLSWNWGWSTFIQFPWAYFSMFSQVIESMFLILNYYISSKQKFTYPNTKNLKIINSCFSIEDLRPKQNSIFLNSLILKERATRRAQIWYSSAEVCYAWDTLVSVNENYVTHTLSNKICSVRSCQLTKITNILLEFNFKPTQKVLQIRITIYLAHYKRNKIIAIAKRKMHIKSVIIVYTNAETNKIILI